MAVSEELEHTEERDERRNPLVRANLFVRQVASELRKVIWPTRKELITYTSVVLVFVVIMAAIISVIDLGAAQAVLAIFGD
jgi:preprotein translocase subunit SecE